MNAIGVHTYAGGGRNFACPISLGIINALADIVSKPQSEPLHAKGGIKYVSVDISSKNPYGDVEDSIPQSDRDDNEDGLFWVRSPET